jgi:hypothetical protein
MAYWLIKAKLIKTGYVILLEFTMIGETDNWSKYMDFCCSLGSICLNHTVAVLTVQSSDWTLLCQVDNFYWEEGPLWKVFMSHDGSSLIYGLGLVENPYSLLIKKIPKFYFIMFKH